MWAMFNLKQNFVYTIGDRRVVILIFKLFLCVERVKENSCKWNDGGVILCGAFFVLFVGAAFYLPCNSNIQIVYAILRYYAITPVWSQFDRNPTFYQIFICNTNN